MTELELIAQAVREAIHIPVAESERLAAALYRRGFRQIEPASEPFDLAAPGEETT